MRQNRRENGREREKYGKKRFEVTYRDCDRKKERLGENVRDRER